MSPDFEQARRLAHLIRRVPGWRASQRLVLPLEEAAEFKGGWMAVAQRQGDDATYLVRTTEDWEILLRQLAEGNSK